MSEINMAYDKNTALYIRDFFIKQGFTIEGAYGMLANIYAGSKFCSNHSENRLGLTDEVYTAQVDIGHYKSFCTDKSGYGLVQWRLPKRKTAFSDFAKQWRVSVSNEKMQLHFIMMEIKNSYPNVLSKLTKSHDIVECAKFVMTRYIRPTDQSVFAKNKCANYGIQLYKDLEK